MREATVRSQYVRKAGCAPFPATVSRPCRGGTSGTPERSPASPGDIRASAPQARGPSGVSRV